MVGDRPSVERVSAPAFVGREPELAALGRALARPPAAVLVAAEPGAGKSRLVQEFLAGSRHRMLVAVCPPLLEALTLGPIVDAIRQVREGLAGLVLGPAAGALRPLLPEWAPYLPPALRPEAGELPQRLLFRGLSDVLDALGATGLVVEDAHWADPVTIEFLRFLAGEQRSRLVVTYRPAELPASSPLRRLPTATELALPPLDAAQTARMISSMLDGRRVSEMLVRSVHEWTGGLPLAVAESVRLLRDPPAELPVPPVLRDSVLERVRRLSPAAQRVLAATAVLAGEGDPQLIAAVGLDPAQAPSAIAEAVAAGLLRQSGQPAFRHPFMAQAVYEAIPGAERRRLHRLAGDPNKRPGWAELRGQLDWLLAQQRNLTAARSEPERRWRGGRRGYGTRPSPRELEVIRLVLAGRTNREIAVALQKSPRTVAGQLASAMRKLGVSSRTELAVRAVEAGLVHDGLGA
jgi:DNA-binding NarL/FixJ family response regulator